MRTWQVGSVLSSVILVSIVSAQPNPKQPANKALPNPNLPANLSQPTSGCIAQLRKQDQPGVAVAFPPGATNIVGPTYEEVSTGKVDQIYGKMGFDTSKDDWYPAYYASGRDTPCPWSIGGTLPTNEVGASVVGVPDPTTVNSLIEKEAAALVPPLIRPPRFPRIVPVGFKYVPPADYCAQQFTAKSTAQVASFCTGLDQSPFHGKDVIFIHGFDHSVILADIDPVSSGSGSFAGGKPTKWPDSPMDFTDAKNGGFRKLAKAYWGDSTTGHVNKFLVKRNAKNRYIEVGWSSAQRLPFAVNTTLYQIADAMINGNGVVMLDPSDPRGMKGFCARGCIVISHSTGAMLTDVAMSSAIDPSYEAGEFSFIPPQIKVHVSIAGAISGSQLGTAAIALAANPKLLVGTSGNAICAVVQQVLSFHDSSGKVFTPPCGPQLGNVLNGILVDLVPQVARTLWSKQIASTPVPVLTVAGESDESLYPVKRFFERGFDDGVVAMDSACGRNVPVERWPSGFTAPLGTLDPRLYDMGTDRSIPHPNRPDRYYFEQNYEYLLSPTPNNGIPRSAAGCTPYKTPWGMLQPVSSLVGSDATTFYPHHYPFIQTAENHGASEVLMSNKAELILRELPSLEDSRAIMNSDVYTAYPYPKAYPYSLTPVKGTGLVSAEMKTLQNELVRGLKVEFDLPFGVHVKWYIWKRTYHMLDDYQNKSAVDYVYSYVN